jgi:NADH:ubiquinone oxidoreductase subunit F (NADH-binding)
MAAVNAPRSSMPPTRTTAAHDGAGCQTLVVTLVHRVLSPNPIADLDEYLARAGGRGIEAAASRDPISLIEELEASGLRGRGGAGFPTGRKWRTVLENRSPTEPTSVVVNGAEGEPGTFKDRTILSNDPYQVIEGALIAARAVGADQIFFGLKRSFEAQLARLRKAIAEIEEIGWTRGIELIVFEGPHEYLYGEETALLETIDGRYPFPRIAPPFRRGVREVVEHDDDVDTRSGLSAHVDMAGPGGDTEAPPTLVDNVETLANVPRIIARGAKWFRTEGTDASPGTIVCTITGSTKKAGIGEVIMGTPLREVIEAIGGGARPGHRIKAVLSGVSNALIPADKLDTPLCYEALAAIGSGLGSAGFIVFDDRDDLVSVAAGASRFLAVESCGQCVPCKRDGLALAGILARLSASDASDMDLRLARKLVATVGDRARCALAGQQQAVVGSVFDLFGSEVDAHMTGAAAAAEPYLIAELLDISGDEPVWDERHREKQPDWSYDEVFSGQFPADKFDEHRAPEPLPE